MNNKPSTPQIEQMKRLFDQYWPGNNLIIEALNQGEVCLRRVIDPKRDLRPGNTVSGPVMMTLVDTALYVAVLNEVGLNEMAVTTSININFLRKPNGDKDVIAKCSLLKVGRKLVVGQVHLFSDGESDPIAHASGTYALPTV